MESMLKIGSLTLKDKVKALLTVMDAHDLENSFYLDALNEKLIDSQVLDYKKREKEVGREFIPFDDQDVNYVRSAKRVNIVFRHRQLEDKLYRYCLEKDYKILAGGPENKFDALIKGAGRGKQDLLIEIKGTISPSEIRMAIGQLIDYAYDLGREVSMAVLLPEKPDDKYIEVLNGVNIACLWPKSGKLLSLNGKVTADN